MCLVLHSVKDALRAAQCLTFSGGHTAGELASMGRWQMAVPHAACSYHNPGDFGECVTTAINAYMACLLSAGGRLEAVSSSARWEDVVGYSRAVKRGPFIYVSGGFVLKVLHA